MDHPEYINELSKIVHANCVKAGWWDDSDRCLYECLQLVSTEIAEATEGARKNLMDTHLKHFKMEEVEYADAIIRIVDIGGKLKLTYQEDQCVAHSFCTAYNSIGKQQLGLNMCIVRLADAIMDYSYRPSDTYLHLCNMMYSDLIHSVFQVAHNRGFGMIEAIGEKIIYNQTRKDHTREHRATEHGKKF